MAINTTTLSANITLNQTTFGVGSTTNILVGVSTTGVNVTLLYCEAELMLVYGVPVSGTVQVIRGYGGTQAVAHNASANVTIGLLTDFPNFAPQVSAFQTLPPNRYQGSYAPVASAATIAAPGPQFHVTGTTAINIITPPANFVEGMITIIFDSACTWTSSAVTNGISASGTATTAKSAVSFIYDTSSALWYPTRLA